MGIVSKYAYREYHTYAECLERRVLLITDGEVTGLPKTPAKRVAHYHSISAYLHNLSKRAKAADDYATRRRYLLLARADAAVARRIAAGTL